MKLIVRHDQRGTIIAIGLPSEPHQGIGVKPKPGQQVSVLDVPQVEHPGHFVKCLAELRVDTHAGEPRVVRK